MALLLFWIHLEFIYQNLGDDRLVNKQNALLTILAYVDTIFFFFCIPVFFHELSSIALYLGLQILWVQELLHFLDSVSP